MEITQRDYNHLFKLLIIGDSGVGKSSMLLRYTERSFNTSFIATVGVDFKVVYLNLGEERLKLQIWDTAGQERFRTITSTYYRGTHGVIVTYDVTNRTSFESVKRWLGEIETNCENVVCVLVGNKCDMENRRQVTFEELRSFAESNQCITAYFETSAYLDSNNGLDNMFRELATAVLKKKREYAAKALSHPSADVAVRKSDTPKKPKKKGCSVL